MTKWEIVHAHYPILCEGKKNKDRCCAWNEHLGVCNTRITNKGECRWSTEDAAKREAEILKGAV